MFPYLCFFDDDEEFLFDEEEEQALLHVAAAAEQGEGSSRRRSSGIPRAIIQRDHAEGEKHILKHYFGPNPVYPTHMFRRRFRMHRHVFLRILRGIQEVDEFFTQRVDCTGLAGLGPYHKSVAACRILAYGVPADAVDEYIQIGESTARDCLARFCRAVIEVFGAQYLRIPNEADIARLMHGAESRGFPGMLGSIDCMHWEWRNCPTAWRGQFCGRNSRPSMILEAVASYDLWIWHAFFGMPGSNNDINVLQRSPVFDPLRQGIMPPVSYTINGSTYNMGYYLADRIYPDWPTFQKAIRHPFEEKKVHFTSMQESCRKDIERAFGVLQARWAVVRGPAYGWDRQRIGDMMTACVIMHNMIVEDEKEHAGNLDFDNIGIQADTMTAIPEMRNEWVEQQHNLTNRDAYLKLQHDLIEHQWARRGTMG